jgi:hypothetical protein
MKTTTKNPLVGKRVEIPAYTDMWMCGARYGVITRVGDNHERRTLEVNPVIVGVRMDHSQIKRLQYVVFEDCKEV